MVGFGFVGWGRAHVLGVRACVRGWGPAPAPRTRGRWCAPRRGHGGELVGTGVGRGTARAVRGSPASHFSVCFCFPVGFALDCGLSRLFVPRPRFHCAESLLVSCKSRCSLLVPSDLSAALGK
jgi:hypothetical protein